MGEVVVIGSLNMDLVAVVPHFPRPGETVACSALRTVPGGKGANQAVAAAKLGCHVSMVGRVGQDDFGRTLLDNLGRQQVATDYVKVDPEAQTGLAMIAVESASGQNEIIIASGANGHLGKGDVDRCQPLLDQANILIIQFETPLPAVEYALEKARHLTTVLNAAPAYSLSKTRRAVGLADILIMNEGEAQVLTGLVVNGVDDALRAGVDLLPAGPKAVVITLGQQGAVLVEEDQREHLPAPVVEVVDTTAAGDAFVGGLSASMLRGDDLLEAVRYATVASSLAVTKLGAQPSLPAAWEVAAFIEPDKHR